VTTNQLSDESKAALRVLSETVAHFMEIRATMPMQYVMAYLHVALNPGLTVNDYARMAHVRSNLMSRYLKDLGKTNRYGEPGFDLVTTDLGERDRREHYTNLTQRGLGVALMLAHSMQRLTAQQDG
jgi:hypothetical protein